MLALAKHGDQALEQPERLSLLVWRERRAYGGDPISGASRFRFLASGQGSSPIDLTGRPRDCPASWCLSRLPSMHAAGTTPTLRAAEVVRSLSTFALFVLAALKCSLCFP